MATKKLLDWTTLLSAAIGAIGGGLTVGITAYTQFRTSQEQFSIDRANMFKDLIADLQDETRARMALLNLWQLYPEKRDQKIIIAAAIETGQPDLVETIVGFDEELQDVADILHAKAVSGERPALQTLERIDPVRAAKVILDGIEEDIARSGDRYFTSEFTIDLINLIRSSEKVDDLLRSTAENHSASPVLLDYLRYAGGRESEFADRVEAAYREKTDLVKFNGFLAKANFKADDVPRIVEAARAFVIGGLKQAESDYFDVSGALLGLNNNSFTRELELRTDRNDELAKALREAVLDKGKPSLVRRKALTLLRVISRREALLVLGSVLAEDTADSSLKSDIVEHLRSGLNETANTYRKDTAGPCIGSTLPNCVNQTEVWTAWLKQVASP